MSASGIGMVLLCTLLFACAESFYTSMMPQHDIDCTYRELSACIPVVIRDRFDRQDKIKIGRIPSFRTSAVVGTKVVGMPAYSKSIIVVDGETNAYNLIPFFGNTGLAYVTSAAVGTKVVGIPYDATDIVVVDVRNMSSYTVIPNYKKEANGAYATSAVVGTKVVGLPFSAKGIVVVDVGINTYTLIPNYKNEVEQAYGTSAVVGNKVVGLPYNAEDIIVVDVVTNTYTFIPNEHVGIQAYATSAVVGTKVVGLPFDAKNIIVVDVGTNTYAFIPKYENSDLQAYTTSAVIGTKIVGLPFNAHSIIVVDVVTSTYTFIPNYEQEYSKAYFTSSIVGNKVVGLPASAHSVVVVDVEANSSNLIPEYESPSDLAYFTSSVVGAKVVGLPHYATELLVPFFQSEADLNKMVREILQRWAQEIWEHAHPESIYLLRALQRPLMEGIIFSALKCFGISSAVRTLVSMTSSSDPYVSHTAGLAAASLVSVFENQSREALALSMHHEDLANKALNKALRQKLWTTILACVIVAMTFAGGAAWAKRKYLQDQYDRLIHRFYPERVSIPYISDRKPTVAQAGHAVELAELGLDTAAVSQSGSSSQSRRALLRSGTIHPEKFQIKELLSGRRVHAALGLKAFLNIGTELAASIAENPMEAIRQEFHSAASKFPMLGIVNMITYILEEPAMEQEDPSNDGSSMQVRDKGRTGMTLADFCKVASAVEARLKIWHVASLRIYTSFLFKLLNDPFRDPVNRDGFQETHPLPATMTFIDEALRMLRSVHASADSSAPMLFWRGMKDMEVSADFLTHGGTELACMSTSTDSAIVGMYARSSKPLIFRIKASSFMSMGADLSEFSLYASEREVLFPPLTYLKPLGTALIANHPGMIVDVEPQI